MTARSPLARVALLASLLLGACSRAPAGKTELMVAAATSLRAAMPALVRAHEASRPGVTVAVTYGASGDLKKQVQGGAPVDVVVFASETPVDELVAEGLAIAGTTRVVATNELVLIGPKGGPPLTFATIDAAPAGEKLAIGDPGAVPAGQYARDALTRLGKWEAVSGRLVYGGDVAAVLAYARRGEVAAAIVYATEAVGIDDIVVLDEARGDWAPRPKIVAAVTKGDRHEAAGELVAFLGSAEAQRILAGHGFGPP